MRRTALRGMKHALFCLFLTFATLFLCLPAWARDPLRIICVESGTLDYNLRVFQGFVRGLRKQDALSKVLPPDLFKSTKEYWSWLSKEANPQNFRFLANGFYSFGWDESRRRFLREKIRTRLEEKRDVDLILAFGTPAGYDMAALCSYVPVLVVGVTNAVEAGIAASMWDSGKDNLVTIVEPFHYRRQLEYYHKIFPFKRLGIVYEDTPLGKSMVSLKEIEGSAKDLGFELVRCTTGLYDDSELVTQHLKACHRQFAKKKVDAVYLTYTAPLTPRQKHKVLEPLLAARIPSFSQATVEDVRYGALLSLRDGGINEGLFAASLLQKIFEGHKPRSLSQIFQSPMQLVIHLHTATRLGWDPPLEVLLSVDKFF